VWIWIGAGALAVALGFFLYWAFVITEGAYLGSRVVAWTYDLTASRYDRIKQFSPLDDAWLLAGPMLHALGSVDSPLILDVATGTGRMPRALLKRPVFQGSVIGLDLSRKMLQEATEKLREYPERYALICRDARDLPFPNDTFDAVSCLEALEFMPAPKVVLKEMVRVLRPGGVFLVTNRINWERRLMPGKAFAEPALRAVLQETGLVQIEFRPWQVYYDLIWARKAGLPSRLGRGTRDITETVRCPRCQATSLTRAQESLACPSCGATYPGADSLYSMIS
jgi:ubiquinone/menaquinone biosynthesis C-methylase UbiE